MTITRETVELFKAIVKGTRRILPEDLKPVFSEQTGRWRPAVLSPLHRARLKRLADIFCTSIPNVTDKLPCAPIRLAQEPKPSPRDRKVEAKRSHVKERMERMPQMIAAWRAERAAQYAKSKPKYPF
jgi:hypothetical protein